MRVSGPRFTAHVFAWDLSLSLNDSPEGLLCNNAIHQGAAGLVSRCTVTVLAAHLRSISPFGIYAFIHDWSWYPPWTRKAEPRSNAKWSYAKRSFRQGYYTRR